MKNFLKDIYADKKLKRISFVMGIVISIFITFGYQLEVYRNVKFDEIITYGIILILTILLTMIIAVVMKYTSGISVGKIVDKRIKPVRIGLLVAVLLFIVYFIQLLGVYPGFFNYDANGQWEMYELDRVTAHHPVIHTLLMGWIMEFVHNITGSYNKGIFCFVALQAMITASCFSYVVVWMYRKALPKWLCAVSFLWFALFPTVVINVFSVTKDSYFAAFLILFVVMTIELLEETEIKIKQLPFIIAWINCALMTAIMRNNAVYIMAIFLPLLVIILRKNWKKVLPMVSMVVILYIFYSGVLVPIFTVDGVSTKEFISVPTQQMMRVYQERREYLSQDEIETYELLYDEIAIEYYNPKISDVVKGHFNIDAFKEDPLYYIKFYFRQGLKFPDVYLNSFLHNTYGFWYPMAHLALDIYGNEGYFVCHSRPPAVDNSAFPLIQKYFLLFENSPLVYGDSLTVILFAPATYFWLFLFTLAQMIYKSKKSQIVVLLFVLLIWLTYLLGPVALVRYVSFLFYLVPVELALLVDNRKKV